MEVRGCINGITLYDDFAHHPTAIQNTLAGLRTRVGKEARILAVFEPRSNTMKLGAMKTSLIESLHEADLIFGYQPKQDSHAKSWRLATALAPLGEPRARAFNTLKALIQALQSTARSGDHVLIMSNGGFGGIHEKLLTGWLAQN
jgi:UDP-N-acetylmuramate: L-alanyl-gamma-D-glutamyl-meso-diaminopimelate ligase